MPACLVLLAIAVRLLYLWQSAKGPTFDAPAIDAARYDELARHLAAEGPLDAAFFWQPSLYPLLLALVYSVLGPSLLAARLLGIVIAGLTCLLTFRLGQRVGGRAVAAVAGGIHALCGPAIFFETELEGAGVAMLLGVALPLVALWAEERRRALPFGLTGVVSGLAVLCRPELLLAVALIASWLLWRVLGPARVRHEPSLRPGAAEGSRRRGVALAALLGAGLLAVLAPVTWLSGRHAGKWSPLPLSGGLNLWLGNAPDLCKTLTIRPGEAWQRLVDEPARTEGERRPSGQERYFLRKAADSVRDHPAAALGNLGRKTLRLVASREVPRNVDIYAAREHSSLLSAVVWRLGPFGFPFGLLLPLAALGLVAERRRVPAPLLLGLVGLALALVLVFPTSRHRLPIAPAAGVLAALGVLALWRGLRVRTVRAADGRDVRVPLAARLRPIWPGGLAALALLGLGTLPGRFCEERGRFAAELHLAAGAYHARHGRPREAQRQYEEALRLAPSLPEASVNLGALLHRRGDRTGALARYDAAVAQRPKSAHARLGRALVYIDLERIPAAIADLRALVRLEPGAPAHRFLLGQTLARAGLFREAQAAFQAADRRAPDDPQTQNALAWLATGRDDPALHRPDEAIRLAERACRLTGHRDPSLLDTLAAAHEAAGHIDQARALYARALDLARRQGKTSLAREIEKRSGSAKGQLDR